MVIESWVTDNLNVLFLYVISATLCGIASVKEADVCKTKQI